MLPSPLAAGGHPGRRSRGLRLEVREARLVLGDGLAARPEFPIVTWLCWMRSGWWRWLHTAPSLARGAGPRRGLGRSEPALSPRRPPPREKWK